MARLSAERVAGLEIAVMFMGSTLLTPLYGIYRAEFGFSEITLTLVYAAYCQRAGKRCRRGRRHCMDR